VAIEVIDWFVGTIWLFLPAYFANAAPVLLHGGGPLDGGRNWSDGKRLLGDHKTVWGTLSGVAVGALVGVVQGNLLQGFLFAVGAIGGDLLFAFIKRRMGLTPGRPLPLWDQVGFILLAILLGSLVEPRPTWQQDVAMILTTIPVHYITNLFAWGLNWKKEPW
jgi:CDP-2,3-bis-(O-geranylgeranyl)-sn-glycerol synthase